jgi:hypothetical protein
MAKKTKKGGLTGGRLWAFKACVAHSRDEGWEIFPWLRAFCTSFKPSDLGLSTCAGPG